MADTPAHQHVGDKEGARGQGNEGNPPSSENGPQRPIRSPSGPSTTRTPRPWPKRPTDDPNDPLTAPTTRLHPKRPTYDPSASHVPSTQGVDSRACTTSAATPAISTRSMRVRRDEEVRREGKGKEMEGAKRGRREDEERRRADERQTTRWQTADGVSPTSTPLVSTRPQPSPTNTPNAVHRRKASTAGHAPQARPPQQCRRAARTHGRQRDEGGKGDETTGADDVPTTSTRHQHAKHRTSTPGVDSRCAPRVRPLPEIDAQQERTERRRGEEGRERRQTTRRRGADDVPTTSTGHQHAKHRTSTPGVDGRVCTASAATPAIDAQHERTERRRETREGKTKEDETSKAEQKG
ncbi:hypothetical protein PAXINDRAFT_21561 [Paxillus involutus ATCC 200175]|uniref:Uncharacterized protein n=1 Tax=Paxillus involutus ATCC 200175 TaxID=664439 RepID=A0A0C9ST71_PAXIN|nr:hypothetical protein PAXINDRAFT_21561 [Paxillus involutus ATCC 200175]